MRSRLLAGVRVVDLARDGAADCGRILASLGAEVVRIDAPADLAWVAEHPWRATGWRLRNGGKHLMTLDYGLPEGRTILQRLLDASDVLVESFTPDERTALALTPEALAASNPRLVAVSITTFGAAGPRAGWAGGELIAQALSGVLHTCGDKDRAPVREPLEANTFGACAAAAFGAVTALHARRDTGRGQHVDISVQEVAASRNLTPLVAWQFDRKATPRNGPRFSARGDARVVWEVKDGFCYFSLMAGKFGATANRALSQWMDDLGYPNPMAGMDWDHYLPGRAPGEKQWEPAIAAFLADRTREELTTEGRRRGLTATAVLRPEEAPSHPQLVDRGHFAGGLPQYFIRTSLDVDEPAALADLDGACA